MRTTLHIDDNLLRRAQDASGIRDKAALVHAGLNALIASKAFQRLASLSGAEPRLRVAPRRPGRRKTVRID
ncbi:MAG: type II toxin-antitoxin system VapB family antitoxin [Acidobacteria bacterium]|nr:type II toxin-antitoxin system VapB family antitoxin [Acidobacteriota bacterium]